jgi:hypothetical protein
MPPMKQTIWSSSRQFVAITDPKDRTTTVYRATSDGKGTKTWVMYGYLRFAWLADDGEHLVADPPGWGALCPSTTTWGMSGALGPIPSPSEEIEIQIYCLASLSLCGPYVVI